MAKPDIIVIGASAGGLEAFRTLISDLPSDLPAAVFIVWHISPDYPSLLPQILERVSALPIAHALHNELIKSGRIYIAPPDRHLLVEPQTVRLSRGPRENRFRPAIDVLFRSAARFYGERVLGVVLSGGLDDGAAGLYAIKQRGGIAVVQDPSDALHDSMPKAALRAVSVDYCVPIAQMAALLVRLVNEAIPVHEESPVSNNLEIEVGVAREDNGMEMGIMKLGEFSPYTPGVSRRIDAAKRRQFDSISLSYRARLFDEFALSRSHRIDQGNALGWNSDDRGECNADEAHGAAFTRDESA